jgi:hypothetical protein
MSKVPFTYDYAVHSDFLIHWTGKDIDDAHQATWWEDERDRSFTSSTVADLYLRRLKDILTYGLWMTEEAARKFLVGTSEIIIPATPQCCFTELKLSESRRHARVYGRLGIGVKRPFLFERFGRPLAYFGLGQGSYNDRFLEACMANLPDKSLLNFFKPMNSTRQLNYDLYSESEWRILLFKELLDRKLIIDPSDHANEKERAYFDSLTSQQQQTLKYLIPLDGWFAMIIYPSLAVKNPAQWDTGNGIVDQIRMIKSAHSHGNSVEGLNNPTRGNWPIEVDLDACRHF